MKGERAEPSVNTIESRPKRRSAAHSAGRFTGGRSRKKRLKERIDERRKGRAFRQYNHEAQEDEDHDDGTEPPFFPGPHECPQLREDREPRGGVFKEFHVRWFSAP